MVTPTNRVAWWLAAVLAAVVLGGIGLLLYLRVSFTLRQTALVKAARDRNAARVRELLDAGAQVNAPGYHPLDAAISEGNRDSAVVELLLARGANPNERDPQSGQTI